MRASALGFKHVVVRFEMFNWEFECILGPKKNVARYVAQQHDDEGGVNDYGPGSVRGQFYYRRGYPPIIWLPRFPVLPREFGTLSHEVGHALMAMCEACGVPVNAENDETFCHAMSYAVRTILEAKRGR